MVVIGLYGIAELCQTMQEPAGTAELVAARLSPREVIRAVLVWPRYWIALLRAPFSITGPLIVIVCLVGTWTVGSAPSDLWMMLAFGAIGYFMSRLQYPVAPLVLAMVLGDRAEDAFRQSMILSKGSLLVFWSNPLAGTIATLALLCFAFPLFSALRRGFAR